MAVSRVATDQEKAALLATLSDDVAEPQNDRPTLERAIAYCKGQAMHNPKDDPAYDRGVAACVRMLEDML